MAKLYAATPTFVYAIRVSSDVTTAPSTMLFAGDPFAFWRPNHSGSVPASAIAIGTSPPTSSQPLRQPKQLTTAQSATKAPAILPHDTAIKSETGALDVATTSSGSMSATAQVATMLTIALSPVPIIVARGTITAEFSTASAGTAALSRPSMA